MAESIERRASFDLIRYANCWEDADVLLDALQPKPGDRILSIASAGDNSLSLLASGATVIAVDLSHAQLACLDLRRAGFAELSHPELLQFLGVTPSSSRSETYRRLAKHLQPAARDYWDQNPEAIANGVIHAGKFENYFRLFRTRLLPLVHGRKKINALLHEKSLPQQREFFDRRWNTWRWRALFRVFFSRFMMGRLGRDPEFFRFVEGSVAQRILQRTEHALTAISTHHNPYLNFILRGNFGHALPHYLRPENYSAIRSGLDRLTLFQGTVQAAARQHANRGLTGFNLSDIFEYLDEPLCEEIYASLLQASRPGAKLVYWNMLVPRHRPERFANHVQSVTEQADELLLRDQAWFYSKLIIEQTNDST